MTTTRQTTLLLTLLLLAPAEQANASRTEVSVERIRLIQDIEERLNRSFRCDFSVKIGRTRKYATANSSGIIMIDRSFLQRAQKGSLFFAIAHEYAHAFLQHDLQMFATSPDHSSTRVDAGQLLRIRRRFEKEADGIAARKAKQMGFDIRSMISFILNTPDPEKGVPARGRIYAKPRDRVDYILAVYQSS